MNCEERTWISFLYVYSNSSVKDSPQLTWKAGGINLKKSDTILLEAADADSVDR